MEIKDYSDKAAKFALYPKTAKASYPALKLGGEFAEFCEAVTAGKRDNLVKELGDCYWYLNELCRLTSNKNLFEELATDYLNSDILRPTPTHSILFWTFIEIGNLQEFIGKTIRDKDGDISLVETKFIFHLDSIFKQLNIARKHINMLFVKQISLVEVLSTNIEKLSDRVSRNVIQGSGDNR